MTTPPHDGSQRIAGPDERHRDTVVQETVVHKTVPPVRASAPPVPAVETRPARPAKTSAAAVFALVFGLAALFCALTALLSPAAVVFGVLGLILAVIGLKMAKRPGVTGKGVAIGGLVTALLGLILGGVILGGLVSVLNNKSQLDRIQSYLDDARAKLPTSQQVRDSLPGQ